MITVDDSLIRMHPHDEVVLLPISQPEVSFDEGYKPPLRECIQSQKYKYTYKEAILDRLRKNWIIIRT